jgi:hypothetical protein
MGHLNEARVAGTVLRLLHPLLGDLLEEEPLHLPFPFVVTSHKSAPVALGLSTPVNGVYWFRVGTT